MNIFNSIRNSYNQPGIHSGNLMYNPEGPKAAWKSMWGSARMPKEGFMHSVVGGMREWTIGESAPGWVTNGASSGPKGVKYGGNLISRGGIKEITHEVAEQSPGIFKIGARRSARGMAWKFAGKAFAPAVFAFTAATQGFGQASEDFLVGGALWGAAKWGASRALSLAPPVLIGAAIIGAGVAARKALIAGRDYNREVRKVSFGNVFNDMYGTAATMRQASIMAIQGSKINGRSALGSEASLMHQ